MIVKNVEEKDKKATIEVEVDAEAFEAAVNKAYLANRGSISIPGFRKGKAPGVFKICEALEFCPKSYKIL